YSPSYSYFPYGAPYGVFYGYPVYYADHVYETRVDESFVDTDVRPEDADVYLDGRYIGAADDYDGYPQYLRIEPGSHTITFTRRGRRTVTREFTAEAGELVSFDFRMQKGYGTAGPVGRVDSGGPAASRDRDEPVEIRPPPAEAPPSEDAGFARLDIRPADASVYIDGEFYGSAARVAGLHGDLRLSAGRHVIEVVRPGYRAVRRELQIRAGDEVRLSFGLQRIRPAR
ncbi:MAG: PEGA domain-containing protein, partial [Acidobacteriota bacterium]